MTALGREVFRPGGKQFDLISSPVGHPFEGIVDAETAAIGMNAAELRVNTQFVRRALWALDAGPVPPAGFDGRPVASQQPVGLNGPFGLGYGCGVEPLGWSG